MTGSLPALPAARRPAGEPIRVVMIAVGGYGYFYLRQLLDEIPSSRAVLAAVVDPYARQSRAWPEIEARGVPVSDSVEGVLGAGGHADLVVIASPIHAHVAQSLSALAHGCDVLVDKPLAATIQDARAVAAARDRVGRTVSVGYQWSYSVAIRSLKHDLVAGVFGRPQRMTTLCAWPRDEAYYRRNSWAGRLRDPESGSWVLDSPANNAMAHFLHNALFVMGSSATEGAAPLSLHGELYRAYGIESADTAACRVELAGGATVVFLASHVTEDAITPRFSIECERGTVTFGDAGSRIIGTTSAGVVHDYGDPDATPQFEKLSVAIDIAGGIAREFCSVEAASSQTLCVNALHDSVPSIVPFHSTAIVRRADTGLFVRGLGDELARCYERGVLPSEAGLPWARAGRAVGLAGYADFPNPRARGARRAGSQVDLHGESL